MRGLHHHPTARLGRDVRLDLAPGAELVLGAGVVVGDGCRFHLHGRGRVAIGAGTVLGERCVVVARERIEVGARCRFGDEVVVMDAEHAFDDVERPVRHQPLRGAAVLVGDDVILGPGAAVRPGARLGDGAIVLARSVVEGAVTAGMTVGGVPARDPGRMGPT